MDLSIHTNGMELTDRLQQYVEKKTERLDRYLPTLVAVRVDLTEQKSKEAKGRQIAQITVRDRRGTILRAEERSNDIFAAVDAVLNKIYRQINRYRGKQLKRRRANGNSDPLVMEPLPIELEEDEDGMEPAVVRRKQFSLMPMSLEEAGEQMELLGHDFFVFFNRDVDAINVLYRRRDGNYGLLQPEIS